MRLSKNKFIKYFFFREVNYKTEGYYSDNLCFRSYDINNKEIGYEEYHGDKTFYI